MGRIIVNHSKVEQLMDARGSKLTTEIDLGETSLSISESSTSQHAAVDLTSTSQVQIALETSKARDPSTCNSLEGNGTSSFAVVKGREESPSSGSSDGEEVDPYLASATV